MGTSVFTIAIKNRLRVFYAPEAKYVFGKLQFGEQVPKHVILSEQSESKDLRTENLLCSIGNA